MALKKKKNNQGEYIINTFKQVLKYHELLS